MDSSRIIETQDGSHSIYSEEFGVSYHSRYGALKESTHVFIEAGFLPKAILQKEIAVLEIGLGTGLNAFLTLIESTRRGLQVHYEGVEAFPISVEEAKILNYPTLINLPQGIPSTFLAFHQLAWETDHKISPHFSFKKTQKRFQEINYNNQFDVLYFDAFAPNAQPELWEPPVLEKMYIALKKEGILVTYCAKGVVKRRFKSLGFEVESLPGPPGKREMTRCIKH